MVSSIYKKLEKHWESYGYKYYNNQDINLSGKAECDEIYSVERFSKTIQCEFANGLLELLIEFMNDYDSDKILNYIERFKINKYFTEIINKIDILIKESILTKDDITHIGFDLVKEREEHELIKLGLILLKFSNSEEALKILKIYSNHNEFIFYVIEAIKGFNNCNSIIFEIAKVSKGYGRIIAVTNIEPLKEEIKIWLIEESYKNNILESFLVAISFNKVDYVDYFYEQGMSLKKYRCLTNILFIFHDLRENFVKSIYIDIIELYCKYFNKYKYSFKSIYVMCALLSLFYKLEGEESLADNLDLSEDDEKFITLETEEFLSKDYSEVVKNAIEIREEDINKIIDVAISLDIDITFDQLYVRLKENKSELCIYNYIMGYRSEKDKEKLMEFALNNLDFQSIVSGNECIYDEELEVEYVEDYCLFLLVYYMNCKCKNFIKYNLIGLKARYIKTKAEALNNLKKIREKLSDNDIDEIKKIRDCEKDAFSRKALTTFLNSFNEDIKKIKYEDINKYKVVKHVKDIYLTNVTIKAGNSIFIESDIEKDDLVYLKRDKENVEDINAIMVLSNEGYLLGYIPKMENNILKNLMDWGKIIYGIILNISEDCNEVQIALYLSYEDVINEVSNAFNMVIKNPIGYLN